MATITRAMSRDGSARVLFINSTDIVEEAHKIHNTSKTMTAALGRALTACSMMGSLLKDKTDKISIQFKGDGPCGSIVCISDYSGNVRGYAGDPKVELPPNDKGKLNVGGAIGNGTLTVVRSLKDAKEPYVGVSKLVSGEIAEDITSYFATSEQTPTVCALGVLANKDNSCRAAGGFLLQLLPFAEESIIPVLETNIASLPPVSSMVDSGMTAEEVISKLFRGLEYDLFDEIDCSYKCPCTRGTYVRGLMSLSKAELEDMVKEGKDVETVCLYCGKKNVFPVREIQNFIGTKEHLAAVEKKK